MLHARRARDAMDMIDRFGIVARGPKTVARELSGGNVQKLLLARELSGHAKVLIAASPTRGLDVAATESVRRLLTGRRSRAWVCCSSARTWTRSSTSPIASR